VASNENVSSSASTSLDTVKKYITQVANWVAFAMAAFHVILAGVGVLPTMQQRCIHLGFALALILLQRASKPNTGAIHSILLVAMTVASTVIAVVVFSDWIGMSIRVVKPRNYELVMAFLLLVITLYATYLRLGPIMPGLAVVFLVYAAVGGYIPGALGHRGYTIPRILSQVFMSTQGIYGTVIGVSATYIALFVIFGALLESSGAAAFFIDLSSALFGRFRGGTAKVATVGSCLFGMVSGSAVANVMAIGPLTIPSMTKSGYTNRFAGALLSAAGTGGQFMPPIMGAAAFIIAETLGIPYLSVALGAFIPGLLYYIAIVFIIDIRSDREGIRLVDKSELPSAKKVFLGGFYLAIPFILLIVFLAVLKWSPIRSGFWSIIAMIAVSWVKKETRMGPKAIWKALGKGAYGCLDVASVCATAGIVVGMISLTGLGLKLSTLLVSLSGGRLIVLLALTALSGLILGMGLNTTSVYIILSVLVAPALVNMGIQPLSAHLFVFYFGILSAITPPVAVASYAAASLAEDEPMPLGFTAWRIGLSGYILPFMFIYNPELLFQGSPLAILKAVITSVIGVFCLSVGLEGYYKKPINWVFRILMFVAAFLLMNSSLITDLAGIVILLVVLGPTFIKNWQQKKENRGVTVPASAETQTVPESTEQ